MKLVETARLHNRINKHDYSLSGGLTEVFR